MVRDIVDGVWMDPAGDADVQIGGDLWALPGLADAHSHLAAAELDYRPGVLEDAAERARDALRAGVTLILDKGWTDLTAMKVIEEVPESERPDIEAAGRILAVEEGYFPGFSREIDSSDDLERAVAEEAETAAGWVKLIGDWPRRGRGPVANFSEAEMRRAVEVAETKDSRVAIHTMARDVPSAAVAAGVHSIEHGLFLQEPDLEDLGTRGGMWVPTLLRVEATIRQLGAGSSGGRLLIEGLYNVRRLLPLALEAGVHVLTGTDLIGSPADVAREAAKLCEYGMSNGQALEAVAGSPFRATGRSRDFAVGSVANAVLFAANPIDDLSALREPIHVIKQGSVL